MPNDEPVRRHRQRKQQRSHQQRWQRPLLTDPSPPPRAGARPQRHPELTAAEGRLALLRWLGWGLDMRTSGATAWRAYRQQPHTLAMQSKIITMPNAPQKRAAAGLSSRPHLERPRPVTSECTAKANITPRQAVCRARSSIASNVIARGRFAAVVLSVRVRSSWRARAAPHAATANVTSPTMRGLGIRRGRRGSRLARRPPLRRAAGRDRPGRGALPPPAPSHSRA
jgi:hypothetical protein